MKIKWIGTAGLLLQSKTSKIVVDPFLKRNTKLPKVDVNEVAQADAAFITHPHFDHFSDIQAFTDAGLSKVYLSERGVENAYKNKFSVPTMQKLHPVFAGETVRVGDFSVRVYDSRHCKFDLGLILSSLLTPKNWLKPRALFSVFREHTNFPIKGSVYAFEISDGEKTAFILGSAGKKEEEDYPTGADLLVFPYQGRSRLHAYAMPYIKEFAPKRVMLDHFDDAFPPVSKRVGTKKFFERMKRELPSVSAFEPTENVWYEI